MGQCSRDESGNMSEGESRQIDYSVWRVVKARWEADLEKKQKLKVIREIARGDMSYRCVDVGNERLRRMLT